MASKVCNFQTLEPVTANTPSVAIVVPVYSTDFSADQTLALRHLAQHLGAYPLYWVAPEGLPAEPLLRRMRDSRVLRFHAGYFASLRTYSQLLTSESFFRAFAAYEYILICQLDALVFSDALPAWCARGDDYCGAPWVTTVHGRRRWATGNGGISLRRIHGALRVLTSRRFTRTLPAGWRRVLAHFDQKWGVLPNAWLRRILVLSEGIEATPGRWHGVDVDTLRRRLFWELQGGVKVLLAKSTYYEDLFWSHIAPAIDPAFRVTPPEVAVHFAFELEPRWCFEQTGGRLPFGCHAWARYDRTFWQPHLLPDA